MDENEKIQQILLDVQWLRDNVNRLISNAESEREVRKDTHTEINKRIVELDKLMRVALYDHDSGFLVKLDRTIQKNNDLPELNKQVKEISDWKIHQQGSMKVVIWMVSIATAVLIGVIVSMLT